MGKHHRKNPNNGSNNGSNNAPKAPGGFGSFGGLNIAELLKNIDFNQVISLLSSFVGAKNMNTNQLSSMIRSLDLNDVSDEATPSKMDMNTLKSQLSALADRLDQVEGGKGNNVHDELMKAVKNIQQTPGAQDALFDFIKSNLPDDDERNSDNRKRK